MREREKKDLQGRRDLQLSSEQMEAMLRDSPYRKQAGKHLESCAGCHDEVESLRKVLGGFRRASEVYAERQAVRVPERRMVRQPVPWGWPIAVGALACGLVTVPLVHRMTTHATAPGLVRDVAPSRTAEMSDEALLEGVQEDLASSVPAPLQLLAASSSTEDSGRTADVSSRSGSAGKH